MTFAGHPDLEERSMFHRLMTLMKDEQGAASLEYGLIAALIAAFVAGMVAALGTGVRDDFRGAERLPGADGSS